MNPTPRRSRLPGLLVVIALGMLLPGTQVMHPARAASRQKELVLINSRGQVWGAQRNVVMRCYRNAPKAPHRYPSNEIRTTTSDRGTVAYPEGCWKLAILVEIFVMPENKPGHGPPYRVFATSWTPGTEVDALPAPPRAAPAPPRVIVSERRQLVLFDVVVDVEWEADLAFQEDLLDAMRGASGFLYDLTDGQMAFGQVTIGIGGRNWPAADIWVLAANAFRPSAYVVGIVGSHGLEYRTHGGEPVRFAPAAIILGRDAEVFAGTGRSQWGSPGAYHTIVHEWLHHAAFLYDGYRYDDIMGRMRFCICDDLDRVGPQSDPAICGGRTSVNVATPMGMHDTAGELWHSSDRSPGTCSQMHQNAVHGEPDWSTLGRWFDIQHVPGLVLNEPPGVPDPGPSSLGVAADLMTAMVALGAAPQSAPRPVAVTSSTPIPSGHVPTTDVYSLSDSGKPRFQGFAVRRESLLVAPTHVGALDSVLGATPRGTLMAVTIVRAPGGAARRYAGQTAAGSSALSVSESPWHPTINLDATLNESRFKISYVDNLNRSITPTMTVWTPGGLCETGCGAASVKPGTSTNAWEGQFEVPPPVYGIVALEHSGQVHHAWFQALGGVGPAHMPAFAPSRDGLVSVDSDQPVDLKGHAVFAMSASDGAALAAPLPSGVAGILGTPLDVDVVTAGQPWQPADRDIGFMDRQLAEPVTITLAYNRTLLDALGIHDSRLRVVHFNRAARSWQLVVNASPAAPAIGMMTTGSVVEDGIYAVAWEP